jgi:hypothetical protein
MLPKFPANQPQNDITFLMKKLVMIGAKVPTTPEGGNHGHTDTITPQPSKTPLHTAEPRAENSSQVTNNTPKPRVETTITPQQSKKPLHTVETRVENSHQVTNNTPKPRVETTITPQPDGLRAVGRGRENGKEFANFQGKLLLNRRLDVKVWLILHYGSSRWGGSIGYRSRSQGRCCGCSASLFHSAPLCLSAKVHHLIFRNNLSASLQQLRCNVSYDQASDLPNGS